MTANTGIVQVLLDFCRQLGVSDEDIQGADTLSAYYLNVALSKKGKDALTAEAVEDFIAVWGRWVHLTLGPSDFALIRVEGGTIPAALPRHVDRLRTDDATIELDIEIDKAALLAHYELEGRETQAFVYLFHTRWIERFDTSVLDLDANVWEGRYRPVVFLLLDCACLYTSHGLAISGPGQLPEARARVALRSRDRQLIDHYREVAGSNLNHVGFRLKYLTPIHLRWQCVRPAVRLTERRGSEPDMPPIDPRIHDLLNRHLFHLGILYTANRTALIESELRATYVGPHDTFEILLSGACPQTDRVDLWRFAVWPYLRQEPDKLIVLQNVIAREFEGDHRAENYRRLMDRLVHVFKAVRWNYHIHVAGKIDRYFEQIQALSAYVSDVSRDVSGFVDSLTKGLTGTFLTALGAVVASFLGALVKGETSGDLFRVSTMLYAVYVLVMAGFRLGSTYHRYVLLIRDAEEKLDDYRELLGEARVEARTSSLDRHRRQFWLWFGLVGVAYLALFVATLWLAPRAEGMVGRWVARSPVATPTPGGP